MRMFAEVRETVISPINIDKTLLDPDAPDDEYIYWFN